MKTKILSCLFVLLLSWFGTCLAAEAETITMSMQDYKELKQNFQTLQSNNELQQSTLNRLREQLLVSQTQQNLSTQDWLMLKQQLTEAQQKVKLLETQCETLQAQLNLAKNSSMETEKSIQEAQQSLTELSKAIKAERSKLEMQRNLLGLAAVYFALRK